MSARLPRGPREVTFNDAGAVPARLERECRFAADEFLDRDAEALAHRSGLSARVVNHQRERHDDRRSALETLCRMLYGARDLGWAFDRRIALVRPILDALGADAHIRPGAGRERGPLTQAAIAAKAAACAATDTVLAMADGEICRAEGDELGRSIVETIEQFHRLRREVEAASGGTGLKAV